MPPQPSYSVRLADGRQFGPASLEQIEQWARQGRVPPDAELVAGDGSRRPVRSEPRLAPIVLVPPTVATRVAPVERAPGFFPYRNGWALVGYYIAVASLIPCLALVAGPTAIVLGIIGLRVRRREPERGGLAHAWVAICLGGLTLLANVAVLIIMAVTA